ncbi:MAG: SpoIIE family protein phosphatase, partial [Leptospira sp.]|nr:SpoIIE family protein phosphatase [Leptospira sp.]
IRDRAYILLTVSIALFGVFLAGVHGTAYQYLYPDFPWIQNRDYTIFSPAIMISMLLFTVDYLELRKNNPAIYKYVKFWILFLGSTMIAFPFLIGNYPALIFQSISGAGLLFTLFQISIGAYLSFKRYRPAYFYMLSFSLFFLSLIIGILTVLSVFPPSPVTALSFQVGFALILILLSIGLADKINILKNSLREANELLEQKVTERTSELSSALSVIHYDLQTAQKIQVNILPGKLEGIGELDIAVKYIPMNKVGGDIYDVTNLQNGKIRVFLADATGHGVQAALMTMSIHSEYQHIKDYQLQPGEILSILNNEYFHRYALLNTYFTCILIDIDIQNDRVIYSSAGHPEQICLVSGKASRFRCSGKLMGVLKDSVYKSEEFDFGKGDRLVLFTDGIFEEFHPNDGEFGEERLFNAIDLQKIIPVKEFSESIIKEVSDFLSGHEQQDDITLLVIERK